MKRLRILQLEDDALDIDLVQRGLKRLDIDGDWHPVSTEAEFLAALEAGPYDVVLSDHSIAGYDGLDALHAVRRKDAEVPFIFVSGSSDEKRALQCILAGATDCVGKDQLWRLPIALRGVRGNRAGERQARLAQDRASLVDLVQQLSLARSIEAIQEIVRRGARALVHADGATFVLREGDHCHYADEDAIEALWKGKRFPMSACVSGWVMEHRQPAAIPDIYADARVPADAYRPTFVKSMVMVPIRTLDPLGAIGTYWARPHVASDDEIALLQALADSTSVAMLNVQLLEGLEQRVRERTAELQDANAELEAFAYSVSHDLRAPLRAISGYGDLLLEEVRDKLDEQPLRFLGHIRSSAARMGQIIEDLLMLSKITRSEMRKSPVDLTRMAREVAAQQHAAAPDRSVSFTVAPDIEVVGDPGLLRLAIENLLSNAWKYTSRRRDARVEISSALQPDSSRVCWVRDNGVGFDMAHALQLFEPFRRMHPERDFAGTGIGLAIVRRVIQKHGGQIWAEAAPEHGATFYFHLPHR